MADFPIEYNATSFRLAENDDNTLSQEKCNIYTWDSFPQSEATLPPNSSKKFLNPMIVPTTFPVVDNKNKVLTIQPAALYNAIHYDLKYTRINVDDWNGYKSPNEDAINYLWKSSVIAPNPPVREMVIACDDQNASWHVDGLLNPEHDNKNVFASVVHMVYWGMGGFANPGALVFQLKNQTPGFGYTTAGGNALVWGAYFAGMFHDKTFKEFPNHIGSQNVVQCPANPEVLGGQDWTQYETFFSLPNTISFSADQYTHSSTGQYHWRYQGQDGLYLSQANIGIIIHELMHSLQNSQPGGQGVQWGPFPNWPLGNNESMANFLGYQFLTTFLKYSDLDAVNAMGPKVRGDAYAYQDKIDFYNKWWDQIVQGITPQDKLRAFMQVSYFLEGYKGLSDVRYYSVSPDVPGAEIFSAPLELHIEQYLVKANPGQPIQVNEKLMKEFLTVGIQEGQKIGFFR